MTRYGFGYIENFNIDEFIQEHNLQREDVTATPVKRVSCFLPSDNNVIGEGAMVEVDIQE